MSNELRGIRAFVSAACDWQDALSLNARERAAVIQHLSKALGYRRNASNNYAENAVGAAANMLFGVRASETVKSEFAAAFAEAFP